MNKKSNHRVKLEIHHAAIDIIHGVPCDKVSEALQIWLQRLVKCLKAKDNASIMVDKANREEREFWKEFELVFNKEKDERL